MYVWMARIEIHNFKNMAMNSISIYRVTISDGFSEKRNKGLILFIYLFIYYLFMVYFQESYIYLILLTKHMNMASWLTIQLRLKVYVRHYPISSWLSIRRIRQSKRSALPNAYSIYSSENNNWLPDRGLSDIYHHFHHFLQQK